MHRWRPLSLSKVNRPGSVTSTVKGGLPGMDFEDFYGRYVDRVASYVLRHTSLRDAEDIVA